MRIKKFFFALPVAFMAIFFAFCAKEQQAPVGETSNTGSSLTQTTDRGGICLRQTVHYTNLAAAGSGSSAFTGNWMQELDRIANNCVLDGSLCQNVSSQGQTHFCCQSEFLISTLLQLGGFQTWPNVTPQGQDFIIAYTLNWARTHLPPCEGGGTPKIIAIDYYRDALITSSLGFTVRWTCCGKAVDHE